MRLPLVYERYYAENLRDLPTQRYLVSLRRIEPVYLLLPPIMIN